MAAGAKVGNDHPVLLPLGLLNLKSIVIDIISRTTSVPSFKSFRSWIYVLSG